MCLYGKHIPITLQPASAGHIQQYRTMSPARPAHSLDTYAETIHRMRNHQMNCLNTPEVFRCFDYLILVPHHPSQVERQERRRLQHHAAHDPSMTTSSRETSQSIVHNITALNMLTKKINAVKRGKTVERLNR